MINGFFNLYPFYICFNLYPFFNIITFNSIQSYYNLSGCLSYTFFFTYIHFSLHTHTHTLKQTHTQTLTPLLLWACVCEACLRCTVLTGCACEVTTICCLTPPPSWDVFTTTGLLLLLLLSPDTVLTTWPPDVMMRLAIEPSEMLFCWNVLEFRLINTLQHYKNSTYVHI